ncbi:MAG: thioredoxin [Gammaproteobacteria bacterium]|nr:MAG: thioredoxin [Gammaproteobacteria bacterium]
MFRKILFAVLLVVISTVQADERAFFNDTFGDFSEELNTARDQGKQAIFIMFEMDECPFCHRMKTTILNQPDVIEYYRKNFLTFHVDIEGDVEITDFDGTPTTQKDFSFKKHRVRATPVLAFFDLQGERIVRYTGATSSKEEFMLLGEFVASGKYKEMNFIKYKREKQKDAG